MYASVVISPLKGPKHGESILEQPRFPASLSIALLDLFNQSERASERARLNRRRNARPRSFLPFVFHLPGPHASIGHADGRVPASFKKLR